MEDLEDSEIQFSEWTDSLDDELMETEDRTTQENIQLITSRPFQSEIERSVISRGIKACSLRNLKYRKLKYFYGLIFVRFFEDSKYKLCLFSC